MTEQFYTEKLLRLPGSFLCYLPPSDSPEIDSLTSIEICYRILAYPLIPKSLNPFCAKINNAKNNDSGFPQEKSRA